MQSLEDVLQIAGRVVESEFGALPKNTNLVILNPNDWDKLKRRRNAESANGIFLPLTQTAFIRESGDIDTILPELIHEYFGHGLYCEQALPGKRLVEFEKQLKGLERALCLDMSGDARICIVYWPNARTVVRISELREDIKAELIKSGVDVTRYDAALLCDSNDKSIREYTQTLRRADSHFKTFLPIYEGFAVWMEKTVLTALGKTDLWIKREAELQKNNPQYAIFLEEIERAQNDVGFLPFLFAIGFPKRYDVQSIEQVLAKQLSPETKIAFAILYGSQKAHSDMDLLVVLDSNEDVVRHNYSTNVDVFVSSRKACLDRARKFDPQFTEPLLTGRVVLGDVASFAQCRKAIEVSQPDIHFLEQKSLELYVNALLFFAEHRRAAGLVQLTGNDIAKAKQIILYDKRGQATRQLLLALNELEFSLSYLAFANRYKLIKRLVLFSEIESTPDGRAEQLLLTIHTYKKSIETGRAELSEARVVHYLNDARTYLRQHMTISSRSAP